MHILFLTPNFPPEVNAPATRTYEHCRRWAQAGHQVTVITGAPNWPAGKVFDGYRNDWHSEQIVDGIRVVRTWTYLTANRGFLRRIAGFASFMVMAVWRAVQIRDVDVLVATSPHMFCGLAGMICRWLRRPPFVLEIRDLWPESVLAVGAMKRNLAIRFFEWLERRMYDSADLIVTVGDGYRQKLQARGVALEKLRVIPNGVDMQAHQRREPDADLRARWRGDGRFLCAYIGTIGMAHGLDVVLDAAASLKSQGRDDVVFWIVGDGAERERLESAAHRRELANVVFTGLLSKEQATLVTATADACLVHLRETELFGTVIPSKIFEALAMEIPIIMGVRGQARDIVLEANGGVPMEPENAASLIAGIDAIRSSPQRFSRGREYVAKHFNRDVLATIMLDVLRDCAAKRSDQSKEVSRVRTERDFEPCATERRAA